MQIGDLVKLSDDFYTSNYYWCVTQDISRDEIFVVIDIVHTDLLTQQPHLLSLQLKRCQGSGYKDIYMMHGAVVMVNRT